MKKRPRGIRTRILYAKKQLSRPKTVAYKAFQNFRPKKATLKKKVYSRIKNIRKCLEKFG